MQLTGLEVRDRGVAAARRAHRRNLRRHNHQPLHRCATPFHSTFHDVRCRLFYSNGLVFVSRGANVSRRRRAAACTLQLGRVGIRSGRW